MRSLRSYAFVYWVLSVAILFAAVGGPDHVHLCLDGQEAAVTLHGPDGEIHHQDDGASHQDEDVDLPQTGVTKFFSKSFVQLALVVAVINLLFWPVTGSPRPARFLVEIPYLLTRQLLPPLRGPPLLNLR